MSPITNKPVHHVADDLLPNGFKKERTRVLTGNDLKIESDERKSVFYWMQRDVRTVDNWALALASYLASSRGQTLRVIYALPPHPMKKEEIPALVNLPVNARHADFLMGGVELVYKELKDLNIPLHLIQAKSHDKIGETVCKEVLENDVSVLVSDFSPIREYRQWMEIQALPLLEEKQVPFYQVDTHNVVPVWAASDKREYAARTIRPKIHKVMDDYLQDFPAISANKNSVKLPSFNREEYENHMNINNSVKPVDWAKPGTDAAMKQFEGFCRNKLDDFGDLRNDPNAEACSNLSPWINHGHISAQRLTMKIDELGKDSEGCETYVEESVIRRELADNFVYYTLDKYDSLEAAYDWAKDTLDDHKTDDREYIYSLEELENGKTHEDVWNAAQLQLVQEGHMHGFMRMYWSKKVSCRLWFWEVTVIDSLHN